MSLRYVVVLVLAGLLYGVVRPGELTYAFGNATLYVFLPPLLFEAAWNLNFRAIRRFWRPIGVLAVPGVLLTAAVIAGALVLVRMPLGPALLAGALLSATDPIAVVAIFRRVRVPHALATIVECESLFNDAIAVVLYRAVLLAIGASAGTGSLSWVVGASLVSSLGGVAIGVAIAYGLARALRALRSDIVQVGGTVVCAYGSYFVADRLHASGIFAAIACGIALRYFERSWITLTIAEEVDRVWERGAFLANAIVFFLVGAALHVGITFRQAPFVIAALGGVALSRFAVSLLLEGAHFPRAWLGVVRSAGLRGALSLALALALPESIPYREAIVAATFAVVIATILSSGLFVPAVVSKAARRKPTRGSRLACL